MYEVKVHNARTHSNYSWLKLGDLNLCSLTTLKQVGENLLLSCLYRTEWVSPILLKIKSSAYGIQRFSSPCSKPYRHTSPFIFNWQYTNNSLTCFFKIFSFDIRRKHKNFWFSYVLTEIQREHWEEILINIYLCIFSELLCTIWHHLYNSKNVKNTHGWLIPPRVFSTFFNLYKWYQIAQSITFT